MRIQITLLTLLLILFAAGTSHAQKKKSKKAKTETAKTDSSKSEKKPTVASKVKGCTKHEGLFTVYLDTASGKAKLFIREDQLGKEFIYQSFSMGGPKELFLNQNMIRDTWVFSISKVYDRLIFTRANTNFYYDPANAISKAADVDVPGTMFYSAKVSAKDATGFLIDIDDLFLSEKLDQIRPVPAPRTPPEAVFDIGNLKSDKSYYLKINSFAKNTDVTVSLAYENPRPANGGSDQITDARYVQVRMQHSFLAMPENDFKPRFDDPRVGYFTEQVTDMTAIGPVNYRDIIHRWNLKKKDPSAALSEPVEPIVWWVENTTPVELRDIIIEAGNKWNKAFEKAGFKNALVMKMMPDDAKWDPADIEYNVIRWVSSSLGYAIGPSFVNPRTGQILGADITIDYQFLRSSATEEQLFESFRGMSEEVIPMNHKHCLMADGLSMQQGFMETVLMIEDAAPEVAKKLKRQFFSQLVLHELGHTLGLNHNMKASQMLSPLQLKDTKITTEMGVMGSVMDYPMVNISSDTDWSGDFYIDTPGPYDLWAIEFGYKPLSAEAEKGELERILNRSTEPALIFGNDADITRPGAGIDPRVCTWDMSSDIVAYGEDRFKLVNQSISKLKDKAVKNGSSYTELRSRYYTLFNHRARVTNAVSHYIGGIYLDRSFPEQQSQNKPFTPIPVAQQKRAMSMLRNHVFAPNAFAEDTYLFPYLQSQRRGFNFSGGTEDPKVEQMVLSVQKIALNFILHPVTLTRINNTGLYGNSYSASTVLTDLVSAVFDADRAGSVNLYRQNLQTELVEQLATIVENKGEKYDEASRSAAFYAITELRGSLARSTVGDLQTKAHRRKLVFMIDQATSVK